MSPSRQVEETWNGVTQLEFAHRLAETDTAQIAAKLKYLRDTIAGNGVIANVAGSAEALKSGGALIGEKFGRFGAPKKGIGDRGSGTRDRCSKHHDASRLYPDSPNNNPQSLVPSPQSPINEVFASPSLQIGFAALTLRSSDYDTPEQVAETVLAHKLSTDTLMEEIRMKGGAYGAGASSDSLERCFSLSTYRDPDPLRSLDSFAAVLKNGVENFAPEDKASQDDVEKMIIGSYARETRPRSPSEKSLVDLLRFFSRIDDGYRRRRLERLVAVSAGEISAARKELASQNPAGKVIIAGKKYAEKAAKALGVTVQTLPI
jgi:Zn-dependent M16 (insulinase) family peptidase